MLLRTEVVAIQGDNVLRSITLKDKQSGKEWTVETNWLFLCLGGMPHTQWAQEVGIMRDEAGYLVTGPDLMQEWPAPTKLDARPGAVLHGNKHTGRIRGRRCATRVSKEMCVCGRRRGDGRDLRSSLRDEQLMHRVRNSF